MGGCDFTYEGKKLSPDDVLNYIASARVGFDSAIEVERRIGFNTDAIATEEVEEVEPEEEGRLKKFMKIWRKNGKH